MRIWRGLEQIDTTFLRSCVAVGSFDGVHLGHRLLIRSTIEAAKERGVESIVFTFDHHPLEIIAPERFHGYLATFDQKIREINKLGCDHLVIAHFDKALRETTPEQFVTHILLQKLGASAIFVGEDFRFGKNHQGDVRCLARLQTRYGFETHALPLKLVNGKKVGSSEIRELLKCGEVGKAREMLGRAYSLEGSVVEGKRLGRTMGFPTANISLSIRQILPADGIYAGRVRWGDGVWKAAVSIGFRPTVNGAERTIESFLLDFNGNLYGELIEVELVERLREERRYDTLDALKDQISRDVLDTDRIVTLL